MNASFNIMYSIEILDESVSPSIPSTVEVDVVNYAVSKYTPVELEGFAKAGKCVTYKNKILYVDENSGFQESYGSFEAKYIDSKTFEVYRVVVDSKKFVREYIYNNILMYKELVSKSIGDKVSKYTPKEILNYYCGGCFVTYKGSLVYIDTINSDSNILYGRFIDGELEPSKITIGSSKGITVSKINNNYKKFVEILSDDFSYNPTELLSMMDSTILTYNGNILYVDKNLSNPSKFYGFYLDGMDMTVYKVSVDASKTVNHSTHKKIIRQIEIDGKGGNYTINGNLDSLDYFVKNTKNLTVNWNSNHFECWLTIDASNYDCNLKFSNGVKFIRDEVLERIDKGHIRELSIKDGVIVSAPVGEEWMEF